MRTAQRCGVFDALGQIFELPPFVGADVGEYGGVFTQLAQEQLIKAPLRAFEMEHTATLVFVRGEENGRQIRLAPARFHAPLGQVDHR